MDNNYWINNKPQKYTKEQWEEILLQADEWGLRLESMPGTKYDSLSKIWDFSGNKEAVKMFGANDNGEYKLGTLVFADIM